METHAQLIRRLAATRTPNPKLGVSVLSNTATSQAPAALRPLSSYHTKEDPLAEEPLEGGPKVYEVTEDSVSGSHLLEELYINPKLPLGKQLHLQQVIASNQIAFGWDDRLGHLDARVPIPLVP